MKKITFLFLCIAFSGYSQIGVGTTAPDSTLDIVAANPTGTSTAVDGILIPRVDRQRALSMTGIIASTMIYVNSVATGTATGKAINVTSTGFYFYDGTLWQKITTGTNNNWTLTGNSGTTGANYVGTSDAVDFKLSTSGAERMRVTSAGPVIINNTAAPIAGDRFSVYNTASSDYAINGYSTLTGVGVYGQNTGTGYGIYGLNNSTGIAVMGIATATGAGVYGSTAGSASAGVFGVANVANGAAVYGTTNGAGGMGLFGNSSANLGIGAFAQATGTNGTGVYGYTNNTGGDGVYGETTAANRYGVWGVNNNASGIGVRGNSTGNAGFGVYGLQTQAARPGVYGTNDNATGYGVYGSSLGANGTGVFGNGGGASGIGTYGTSAGTNGFGVYGVQTQPGRFGVYGINNNGTGIGVAGTTTGAAGIAVSGTTTGLDATAVSGSSIGGNADGVYGQATGATGYGVWGVNNNANGNAVVGNSSGANGFGVSGTTTGANSIGVYGSSTGAVGIGSVGYNSNVSGTGFVGSGNNVIPLYMGIGSGAAITGSLYGTASWSTDTASGIGIAGAGNNENIYTIGTTGAGGAFSGNRWAVTGVSTITGAGNDAVDRGVLIGNYVSGGSTIDNVYVGARVGGVNYKILGTGGGSVSTTMKTSQGERILFAPEATENWFFDMGEVELVNGKATVDLDPIFVETLSDSKPFKVFVQGGENTLGSIRITRNQAEKSFIIEDLGGTSSGIVQYSVYGIWKGKENLRMPELKAEEKPKPQLVQSEKLDFASKKAVASKAKTLPKAENPETENQKRIAIIENPENKTAATSKPKDNIKIREEIRDNENTRK